MLLGGGKGHIYWGNLYFIQTKLYFSPSSPFFSPSAMGIHSPCSVRLCVEEELAQGVSSTALFSCSACPKLKGWSWVEQFVHLVSVWVLSAGEIFSFGWLQRGLATEAKLGFYPLNFRISFFFFFLILRKGQTDIFPMHEAFYYCSYFKYVFWRFTQFIWG